MREGAELGRQRAQIRRRVARIGCRSHARAEFAKGILHHQTNEGRSIADALVEGWCSDPDPLRDRLHGQGLDTTRRHQVTAGGDDLFEGRPTRCRHVCLRSGY